jgi:diguanylate cyclase (GGDEF)-like protein
MYSLYHSLLAQHPRQLTPIRCAPSTIVQLHRYFEDVVIENSLAALVIETLPTALQRTARETARMNEVAKAARDLFLFVSLNDPLSRLVLSGGKDRQPVVVRHQGEASERFVVIADRRFSALLASIQTEESDKASGGDLMVWTFEPDIVYSALEYLMARVTAENSFHAAPFAKAVRLSMPKSTSLQLMLGVTTKLALLIQEQAEREIAVNRIATAIRNSMELDIILQTAANEVGRSLNIRSCGVSIAGKLVGEPMTRYYFRPDIQTDEPTIKALLAVIETSAAEAARAPNSVIVDGDTAPAGAMAHAIVPLIYQGDFVGILRAESDGDRVWADTELLLLHTVADQLTVAVKQAHLFAEMQQQALTDGLTGCYNRRSFDLQLQRDLHLATRMRQPISLIMIDLDHFKNINDRAGHEAGDLALRMLAEILRSELRAVDTAARFGGDEFAIILPQATIEGAKIVAERLRVRIQQMAIPGYGAVTASFGLASFPSHASSRDTIVVAADRALYKSKHSGRNRISVPADDDSDIDQPDQSNSNESLIGALSVR